MRKLANLFLLAIVVLLSQFISNCQFGGSELPNEVSGELLTQNNRPVANMKVELYSVNYIPADSTNHGLSYSTKTDATGSYSFKNVPAGQYNVVGLQDSLGFFRDSITVSGQAMIGKDSLRLLGQLTGMVKLQPQDEPQNAVVQVMGTNNYINVSSTGLFTLSGLAEGTYRLRVFVALPNYVPLFTEVRVRSGKHDTLPNPLVPFYSGIPVVENIQTSLDTASGIAKITWHAVSYPGFLSYMVYRDPANSITISDAPINHSRIVDTVFYDTLYRDPSGFFPQSWEYRVRVQGQNSLIGEPFKPEILNAVPPSIFYTQINFQRIGDSTGNIFKGDTLRLVVNYSNAMLTNKNLVWIYGVADTLAKLSLTQKIGSDTLVWTVPTTSKEDSLRVSVTDANGIEWKAVYPFSIRISRIIGKINTLSTRIDAYPWKGKIVHVSMDSVGKIFIGLFDPSTKKDLTLASPNIKKGIGSSFSVAHSGSKLYLIGSQFVGYLGSNCITYNLETGAWAAGPNITGLFDSRASVVSKGKLYVFYSDSVGSSQSKLVILDSASGVLSAKKSIDWFGSEVRLSEIGGKVYCVADINFTPTSRIIVYDSLVDNWAELPVSQKLGGGSGTRIIGLNGRIYKFGGFFVPSFVYSNAVEFYDPVQEEWITCSPLLTSRAYTGIVNLGSKIFILGGTGWEHEPLGLEPISASNRPVTSNLVEEYQP